MRHYKFTAILLLLGLQPAFSQSVLHKNINKRASHLKQSLNQSQESLFLSSYRGIDSLTFIPREGKSFKLFDKGFKVGVDLKQFPSGVYTVCVYKRGGITVLNVDVKNTAPFIEKEIILSTPPIAIAVQENRIIPFGRLYKKADDVMQTREEFKRSHRDYKGGEYVQGVQESCKAYICPHKARHFNNR